MKRHPIKIGKFSTEYFQYDEVGLKGLGKHRIPIVNMDPYIDHSMDEELHIEICKGLALSGEQNDIGNGRFFCDAPPHTNTKNAPAYVLYHLSKFDPSGIHRNAIEEIVRESKHVDKALVRYLSLAFNTDMPWYSILMFDPNSNLLDDRRHFPKLFRYVQTLPFKSLLRVIIMSSFPNTELPMHRDYIVERHKRHLINLFFHSWRPMFVYDEVKREKIYLEKGSKSYFFNSRDYHGVDPEPNFRYTVRVEGTFTDDMCDKLGLIDGYTWHESYERTS